VLFANFAEAIAEARGRAQANSLRKTREETPAKRIEPDGQSHIVSSSELKQGDLFECVAGDTVAADGEIVEGLASIDESAITGESAPVIRAAHPVEETLAGPRGDFHENAVGEDLRAARDGAFVAARVEGSSRQKTPNEIALTILLAGFTLVFVIVSATLKPFADYVGANITVAAFISLFVCLIPTTIGGLLSAIGIAGMDRALRANVITKSGKAVETAGSHRHAAPGQDRHHHHRQPQGHALPSRRRHRPQGFRAHVRALVRRRPDPRRQIRRRAGRRRRGPHRPGGDGRSADGEIHRRNQVFGRRHARRTPHPQGSRRSDLPHRRRARKPLPGRNRSHRAHHLRERRHTARSLRKRRITGVIELQDIIKTGIRERFERLRRMGVKTVMVTGHNPLTAKSSPRRPASTTSSPKHVPRTSSNTSAANSSRASWWP